MKHGFPILCYNREVSFAHTRPLRKLLSFLLYPVDPKFMYHSSFAADAVCWSVPLADLIPQIQYSMRQGSEFQES